MEESKQIIVKERPNSFEFGPANSRLKIYHEDAEDLKKQLEDYKFLGIEIPAMQNGGQK